jgi:hypothetical protein
MPTWKVEPILDYEGKEEESKNPCLHFFGGLSSAQTLKRCIVRGSYYLLLVILAVYQKYANNFPAAEISSFGC